MTISPVRNNGMPTAVKYVLFGCMAFLAAEPAAWLARTWFDNSWGSYGEYAFLGVLGLFAWSVTSGRNEGGSTAVPALLFAVTALVRVAGHVLAVNVIGALALVIDVYAIGLLFGLHQRRRAVSPLWLAALFALALPLERIVQRVIGFGLQQVSAAGACGALSLGFDDVRCNGVDIVLAGQHVLVDLPCSGARGLLLLWTAFVLLAALIRPRPAWAAVGIVTALVAALVSNTIRIVLLAIGIGFPAVVGVDVMVQPWHDLVGLGSLGLGLAPVVIWARSAQLVERVQSVPSEVEVAGASARWQPSSGLVAATLMAACLAVTLTPHTPVDVAREVRNLRTPAWLAGHRAQAIDLTEQERDYFTQFGGASAKARFGSRTLLLVRTSAPLRHLHAPDECLAGAGFEVQRLGISHGAMPGATYRATAPDGQVWRVNVTYLSDAGHTATSISQAVWIWLRNPHTTWTAIERAHPWSAPDHQNEAFDIALARSLEALGDSIHNLSPNTQHTH